ncbi:MAG: hypothetical protein RQM92_01070 [Candidatus Syntrophopropionicum ammoniitolerans]
MFELDDSDDIGFFVNGLIEKKFREISYAHISVIADDRVSQWESERSNCSEGHLDRG